MNGAGPLSALGLFTVVPTRSTRPFDAATARAAMRWLPILGAGLGAGAALPLVAIRQWAPHAELLGAIIAIGALAGLTRGLHLDGLADTADGLGSHAPAPRALEIMRQSDIGPFGVITLVLVLGADVAALAAIGGGPWTACAGPAVACATGRLAALHASPARPARPDGLGAVVTGAATPAVITVETLLVLGGGAALAAWAGAPALWWVGSQVLALAAAMGFRLHTTRRLGGTTGDVFGAVIEIATGLTLVLIALH